MRKTRDTLSGAKFNEAKLGDGSVCYSKGHEGLSHKVLVLWSCEQSLRGGPASSGVGQHATLGP